jgi:hypothetical protein
MVEDQMLENQLKEGQKRWWRGKLQRTTGTFLRPRTTDCEGGGGNDNLVVAVLTTNCVRRGVGWSAGGEAGGRGEGRRERSKERKR